MPTDIFPGGTVNRGSLAPGMVAPEKATPNDRVRSFARAATATTSSMESPRSADAPAHLKTKSPPAMPRRFASSPGPALEMSSVTVTVRATIPASLRAASAASKLSTSPA